MSDSFLPYRYMRGVWDGLAALGLLPPFGDGHPPWHGVHGPDRSGPREAALPPHAPHRTHRRGGRGSAA
ncbi:hypothetical protein [Streptomyces sp. NPDC101776]|uniref:hypothetical protein n=1 Tax=Streptomyces sp. NPDC101776 TaxID=3366146 RepID=UPI0037FABB1E